MPNLPKLTPTPSCTSYLERPSGSCLLLLFPSPTGKPCRPSTTKGQICTVRYILSLLIVNPLTPDKQVLGATLPTPTPTGTLQCREVTNYFGKDVGKTSLENAYEAIERYCDRAKEKKVTLDFEYNSTHLGPLEFRKFVDFGRGKSIEILVGWLFRNRPSDEQCARDLPYSLSFQAGHDACKQNLRFALDNCKPALPLAFPCHALCILFSCRFRASNFPQK